jgi:hypothetical protein
MALPPHEGNPLMVRRFLLATGAMAGLSLAVPVPLLAGTGHQVRTRLVDCAAQSCLVVRGYRKDAGLPIRINGHDVAASGQRHWQVRLPVARVRDWSAPFARSIEVETGDVRQTAALPVGMLGSTRDLAMLVVTVK